MEDPLFPRDPNHRFGMASGDVTEELTCRRMEDLTRALRDSTKITPRRFTWITPQDLCYTVLCAPNSHQYQIHQEQQHKHQEGPFVIVDIRTAEEADGGCIVGAMRANTHLSNNEVEQLVAYLRAGRQLSSSKVEQLVAHYRAGRRIIFYCLRSHSRAPLAAQKLLQVLDLQGQRHGAGAAADAEISDPKVGVVQGGLVGIVQGLVRSMPAHVQQHLVSLHDLEQDFPISLISHFEADKWAVTQTPDGPLVAHVSECQVPQSESREAEELMEEEMSEELAYLVDHRMSLQQPPAGGSMPYIS